MCIYTNLYAYKKWLYYYYLLFSSRWLLICYVYVYVSQFNLAAFKKYLCLNLQGIENDEGHWLEKGGGGEKEKITVKQK